MLLKYVVYLDSNLSCLKVTEYVIVQRNFKNPKKKIKNPKLYFPPGFFKRTLHHVNVKDLRNRNTLVVQWVYVQILPDNIVHAD